MVSDIIDTYTEEVFISNTLVKIKKQFRPLASVKTKWFIHRILPKDTILVEWENRARLELEIDISQWFSNRIYLEQLLWQELALIRDELDPNFKYSSDYVTLTYGPESPRQRYFPVIRIVWNVYCCGRLYRRSLPLSPLEDIKSQFYQCFGENQAIQDWFNKLFFETTEYTFGDLEKIAQKVHRLKSTSDDTKFK